MRHSMVAVAPTLVVLATVGWLLRPYLEPPAAPGFPKSPRREIDESLLTPSLLAMPARNPFRLAGDADVRGQPAPDRAAPARGQAPPAARAEARAVAAAPGPLPGLIERLRGLARATRTRLDQAGRAEAEFRAEVRGKVRLSATSIRGDRRIAILDGRAYPEGESIACAAGTVVLIEVRPASVILGSRGRRAEVSFPPHSTATGPPPPLAAGAPSPNRSATAAREAGPRPGRPR